MLYLSLFFALRNGKIGCELFLPASNLPNVLNILMAICMSLTEMRTFQSIIHDYSEHFSDLQKSSID